MQDLGRMPYRDFFEQNAPGTLVFSALLHHATGGGSLSLRFIDLSVLSAISGVTVFALRSHGWRAGVLAASCFAIVYLGEGPVQSLQREYLALVPMAISIGVIFHGSTAAIGGRSVSASGLMAGIAASVKPPLVVCWGPLLVVALVSRLRAQDGSLALSRLFREGLAVLFPFLLGLSLVPLLLAIWMNQNSALDAFLDMARNYYPLYAELKGNGFLWQSGSTADLVQRYVTNPLELIASFRFVIVTFFALGVAWTYRTRPGFVQCAMICGLVLCALLYLSVSGKFWVYHGFPLFYALSLLAGLSVSRELACLPGEASWRNAILCATVAVGLPLNLAGREFFDWREGKPFIVKEGRVDLIADYLERNVGLTETVLPLDVTSGAIHGLYRNRRPLYGRFIYDQYFYHHVKHPYIQRLRREMLAQFKDGEPDIVVRLDDTWLRTPDFPELDAILSADYQMVLHENGVSILRRRSSAPLAFSGARGAPETANGGHHPDADLLVSERP
ncbi:MAG: hypothetical protein ACT4QD_12245 [Acidobacteriota bacterium]